MPGKARAGQGESDMDVSDAEGGSGGAEVSLAAIALLGETSAYVGQTMGTCPTTPVASKSKPVTSTPAPAKAVPSPAATKVASTPAPTKAVSTPASVKVATTPTAKAVPEDSEDFETPTARGRAATKGSDRANRASTDNQDKTESEASPPRDEALPEFDPAKVTPGYVPMVVSKGEDDYMIVVSGVKDTGLCEAEEFLMDQTPFFSSKNKKEGAKRGGRPRKKDLDENMDGVAKLGSNMYFYTGPGGAESPPSLHNDDEDLPVKNKKQEVEGSRKSGRAGKGRNPRLEREDEVVDIPQVTTLVASKSKSVTSVTTKAVSTPASVKVATTPTAKAVPEDSEDFETLTARGRASSKGSDRANRASTDSQDKTESEASPPRDEALPEFDPAKFTPGYVPKVVSKGEDDYMIVVSGVKDTGLCGGYWGNTENLSSRRRSKPPEALQIGKAEKAASRRGSIGSSVDTPSNKKTTPAKKDVSTPVTKINKKQVTETEKRVENMESSQSESEADTEVNTSKGGRGRKRKNGETPPASQEKKAKTSRKESAAAQAAKQEDEEDIKASFSDYDSGANETQPLRTTKRPSAKTADSPVKDAPLTSKQQTAVSAALAAGVPAGQQRSVSCVEDTSTQREVVVECFAPYDDHRWVNIGKERDGMAPDAVQYARALRPPYHLLSFLRIKGHSTKGMSCTDKNTMVFVVLEGEITVILHTTQFNAKKGDSLYIPPKNYYNLINQKAREAELSLIQFQYDGPLPTVQPNSG